MRVIEREYAAHEDVYLRGQIALVSGDLPDGARALLVRDPSSPDRPLLVLSELSMDDGAIASAIAALSEDVRRTPKPAARRVLRVTENRGGVGETGRAFPLPHSSGRELAQRLYARATSVTTIDVPEVGRAKLLRFE